MGDAELHQLHGKEGGKAPEKEKEGEEEEAEEEQARSLALPNGPPTLLMASPLCEFQLVRLTTFALRLRAVGLAFAPPSEEE